MGENFQQSKTEAATIEESSALCDEALRADSTEETGSTTTVTNAANSAELLEKNCFRPVKSRRIMKPYTTDIANLMLKSVHEKLALSLIMILRSTRSACLMKENLILQPQTKRTSEPTGMWRVSGG